LLWGIFAETKKGEKITMNSLEQLLAHTGQRLKTARKQKGMTQGELANRLSIAQNSVSRYEAGSMSMTLPTLYEMAQALEIPISYFFEMLSDEATANEYDALDEGLQETAKEIIKWLRQEQEQLTRNPHSGEERQIVVTVNLEPHETGKSKDRVTRLSYKETGGQSSDLRWSVRTITGQQPFSAKRPEIAFG
jgi:transcriptional regulator with XRE-family HTH domain